MESTWSGVQREDNKEGLMLLIRIKRLHSRRYRIAFIECCFFEAQFTVWFSSNFYKNVRINCSFI